jgi:histidyl-tRNA synthetase
MNDSKRKYKPRSISGFPELLPEERIVELRWLDTVRAAFESYGFCSIETPSVEEIQVLAAKGGDVDKEIYALRRLAGTADDPDSRLALHYDLTVPLARYVAQHHANLVFPFKRYQIQRVWRGERPQEGRFREFYQCDIDIIDNNDVSIHFDAELPEIVYQILQSLNIGDVSLNINNRKILEGFYRGLGIKDTIPVIRVLDKLDKMGAARVRDLLIETLDFPALVAEKCLTLANIKTTDSSFVDRVRELNVESSLLDEGLMELDFVMRSVAHQHSGVIFADLSIARGFDYYTGTVYEGKLIDFPNYPSICSGGRYDNLVGAFSGHKLPGVGISIGLTRIFSKLLKEGLIPLGPKGPTDVLVAYIPGETRSLMLETARILRSRGLKVEMYHEERKMNEQLRYAERKGIPYVWFPSSESRPHEVKNIGTAVQVIANPANWLPGMKGG